MQFDLLLWILPSRFQIFRIVVWSCRCADDRGAGLHYSSFQIPPCLNLSTPSSVCQASSQTASSTTMKGRGIRGISAKRVSLMAMTTATRHNKSNLARRLSTMIGPWHLTLPLLYLHLDPRHHHRLLLLLHPPDHHQGVPRPHLQALDRGSSRQQGENLWTTMVLSLI